MHAHPCPRRRHLRSKGCNPRSLRYIPTFLLCSPPPIYIFFYVAHRAISFVAEHDRWWLSSAAFPPAPRFGPRVSSQWMETADYVCATFGGSGCISLCATLIRKMNDLVSGSRQLSWNDSRDFVSLKRIGSLTNFRRCKYSMGYANGMMDAHLLHKGNSTAFVFATRWQ